MKRRLHAVNKITKDVCHNLWRAQTALIHYTRGPAEWLTLKPDTGMLTHLLLGDSGTRLQRHSPPRTPIFRRFHRATNTSDEHEWRWTSQTSGAYHFNSSSSTHLHSPRINASQPTRSKPCCTNRSEEEGLTWSCAAISERKVSQDARVWFQR